MVCTETVCYSKASYRTLYTNRGEVANHFVVVLHARTGDYDKRIASSSVMTVGGATSGTATPGAAVSNDGNLVPSSGFRDQRSAFSIRTWLCFVSGAPAEPAQVRPAPTNSAVARTEHPARCPCAVRRIHGAEGHRLHPPSYDSGATGPSATDGPVRARRFPRMAMPSDGFSIQRSAFSVQHSAFIIQHSALSVQNSALLFSCV